MTPAARRPPSNDGSVRPVSVTESPMARFQVPVAGEEFTLPWRTGQAACNCLGGQATRTANSAPGAARHPTASRRRPWRRAQAPVLARALSGAVFLRRRLEHALCRNPLGALRIRAGFVVLGTREPGGSETRRPHDTDLAGLTFTASGTRQPLQHGRPVGILEPGRKLGRADDGTVAISKGRARRRPMGSTPVGVASRRGETQFSRSRAWAGPFRRPHVFATTQNTLSLVNSPTGASVPKKFWTPVCWGRRRQWQKPGDNGRR